MTIAFVPKRADGWGHFREAMLACGWTEIASSKSRMGNYQIATMAIKRGRPD